MGAGFTTSNFSCSFFDDFKRKNCLAVSDIRGRIHILTYVISRCRLTYLFIHLVNFHKINQVTFGKKTS